MCDDELLPSQGVEDIEPQAPRSGHELNPLANRFMSHLERYFRGSGHPDHPLVRDLIKKNDFTSAKADPAFRAREFLKMMSGTKFLPITPREMTVSGFNA